ncbi:MAG: threonine-phosphate decarboxylase CobD [Nitrospirota bacterium]
MFKHGGNIYRFSEEINIPEKKIIDFSASINPLGVPEKVRHEINRHLSCLGNYPDPDTKALRSKLARYHNLEPESILCGNGSTELIYLIPRALRPEKVLIPHPTFSEYERACKISNELQVMRYELKKEDNFDIAPDEFISAIERLAFNSKLKTQNSKLVFLCNPNNPTGRLLKRHEVLEIANAAAEMKCYLIVDEAFIDFCPEDSVIDAVQSNPYLIVMRSMTKFYALSGLRVGYGVFPLNIIETIKKYKEPWTVNSLAQRAGLIALGDTGYRDKTIRLIKKEKQFLENNFKKIGIKFYPSEANFYLLKVNNADEIYLRLSKKGILVRDCSNFRGLDSSYIRVAVKPRADNLSLIKELTDIIKGGGEKI